MRASSKSGKRITYRLLSHHPFIKINQNDGSIEINYKDSPKYSPKRSQITTFRVAASTPRQNNRRCRLLSCRQCRSNTWVRIIALRLYYGDKIIQSLQGNFSSLVKTNHLSRVISPESLYRVVRWISPRVNVLSTKISSAQARLDKACTKLSLTIRSHFKSKCLFVTKLRYYGWGEWGSVSLFSRPKGRGRSRARRTKVGTES